MLVLPLLYFLLKLKFQGISSVSPPRLLADLSISYPSCAAFCLTSLELPPNLLILQLCIWSVPYPAHRVLMFNDDSFHLKNLFITFHADEYFYCCSHAFSYLFNTWNTLLPLFFSDACTLSTFEGANSISFVDSVLLWFIFVGGWFTILIVSSSSVRLFFLWDSLDPRVVKVSLQQ